MLPNGIDLEQQGKVVTVRFDRPEVSHTEMQDTVGECLELIRYSNAQNFVLDLGPVTFLASACLGSLVGFLQEIEHIRGRIALVNCQDNVAFLFKVTRLDHVFDMFEDTQEALASF